MNYPHTAVDLAEGRLARLIARVRPAHVVLLACVLRLALFVAAAPWQPESCERAILKSDALQYHTLSSYLATNGSFHPEPIRTPGYLCFVAAIYAVGGAHPWPVLLVQIVMDAVITWLCFLFASRMIGTEGGLVAALFYAIDPAAILNTNTLMSDTLFTLFLVLAALALQRAIAAGVWGSSLQFYLLGALFVGFAALTRPLALYFMPLYVLLIFWNQRKRILQAIGITIAATGIFVAVLTPWVIHNHQQYGEFGLSSSGSLNLFYLYAVSTESLRSGVGAQQAIANIKRMQGVGDAELQEPRDNLYRQHQKLGPIALDYLGQHPGWFLWATGLGLVQMFTNSGSGSYALLMGLDVGQTDLKDAMAERGMVRGVAQMVREKSFMERLVMVANTLVHIVQYAMVLYGLWILRRDRFRGAFVPLLLFVALYSVMIGAAGLMRFKLPIVPFYLPIAGLGCVAFALRGSLSGGHRVRLHDNAIVIAGGE